MHVLVVESDPIVAAAVVRSVPHKDITVASVASALQAIQACDTQTPDAVVLDISLTGHSGIEFLHEFKSYSDWNNIPVIAWTMHAYTPAQQKALTLLGVQRVLYKPSMSLQQLWQHINDVVLLVHA